MAARWLAENALSSGGRVVVEGNEYYEAVRGYARLQRRTAPRLCTGDAAARRKDYESGVVVFASAVVVVADLLSGVLRPREALVCGDGAAVEFSVRLLRERGVPTRRPRSSKSSGEYDGRVVRVAPPEEEVEIEGLLGEDPWSLRRALWSFDSRSLLERCEELRETRAEKVKRRRSAGWLETEAFEAVFAAARRRATEPTPRLVRLCGLCRGRTVVVAADRRDAETVAGCLVLSRASQILVLTQAQLDARVDVVSELRATRVILLDDVEGVVPGAIRLETKRARRRQLSTEPRVLPPLVGGPPAKKRRRKVLVDARELRSPLPRLLHEAGCVLEVAALPIADFVLSRRCGVERKAVPADLLPSLDSGRLWNQLRLLVKAFQLPVLLLEYPAATRPLSDSVPDRCSETSAHAKLAKLAIEFPGVRFVWSPAPPRTVDLFDALSSDGDGDAEDPRMPDHPGDRDDDLARLLQKIPGCEPHVSKIITSTKSLRHFVNLSLDDRALIMGKQDAQCCHAFLHQNHKQPPKKTLRDYYLRL
ncbi:hypothetical protein CTAYLR_008939 [Chrysophaeum taylorii]|uniref:ERCC4 domain-containing protein n=1 Tax=Chrysophaeum taylorii TaxID=2483200 RepID=A0AAD7XKH3_9STRA|nr:hypothetical protein CTAYLR_008939 [Chrysophaeum taylorii]